jgi:hypothetical protein
MQLTQKRQLIATEFANPSNSRKGMNREEALCT